MNLQEHKKRHWHRMSFWQKVCWVYLDTPFSLFWWEERIEDIKLWWILRK